MPDPVAEPVETPTPPPAVEADAPDPIEEADALSGLTPPADPAAETVETPADAAVEVVDAAETVADPVADDATPPPAETVEETATAVETPPKEAGEPPPTPPEPPAEDPAAAQARAANDAAYLKYQTDLADIQTKLASEEYVVDSDEAKQALRVLLDGQRVAQQKIADLEADRDHARQAQSVDAVWQGVAQANPGVDLPKLKTMFNEEAAAAHAKGYRGDVLQAVASERFNDRLAIIRGQAKAKEETAAPPATPPKKAAALPAKPKAPVTPGAARVTPAASNTRPPAPKPKTFDEMVAETAGRIGNVSALLD